VPVLGAPRPLDRRHSGVDDWPCWGQPQEQTSSPASEPGRDVESALGQVLVNAVPIPWHRVRPASFVGHESEYGYGARKR
jgi:hypothetical protein